MENTILCIVNCHINSRDHFARTHSYIFFNYSGNYSTISYHLWTRLKNKTKKKILKNEIKKNYGKK